MIDPTPPPTEEPAPPTADVPPAPLNAESLPPGWQQKLESGEVGIEDLPNGLAKKLN